MRIAIFENEVDQVRNSFNIANAIKYDGELEIRYYVSSEECSPFETILDYDFIFVDLDLSINSPKDGYSVIKDIQDLTNEIPICIITGAKDVESQLEERNITVDVLEKPLSYKEILLQLERI